MTVSPQQAPEAGEQLTIGFKSGVLSRSWPIQVSPPDGDRAQLRAAVATASGAFDHGREPLCRHEEPLVCTKLQHDHSLRCPRCYVEQLTMDRYLMHLRDRLAPDSCRNGLLRAFGTRPRWMHSWRSPKNAQAARHGRCDPETLQGQHHGRQPAPAPQPLR